MNNDNNIERKAALVHTFIAVISADIANGKITKADIDKVDYSEDAATEYYKFNILPKYIISLVNNYESVMDLTKEELNEIVSVEVIYVLSYNPKKELIGVLLPDIFSSLIHNPQGMNRLRNLELHEQNQ